MRSFYLFILAIVLPSFFVACDSKKDEVVTLDSTDTLQVKELVNKFQSLLEKSDIKAAADLLYYDNDGKLEPLTDSIKQGMTAAYNMFPIQECRMQYYKLKGYGDDAVKFSLVFQSPNPSKPIETAIYLKPVLDDGQWHLVMILGEAE